jgi:hypothetical protein
MIIFEVKYLFIIYLNRKQLLATKMDFLDKIG